MQKDVSRIAYGRYVYMNICIFSMYAVSYIILQSAELIANTMASVQIYPTDI